MLSSSFLSMYISSSWDTEPGVTPHISALMLYVHLSGRSLTCLLLTVSFSRKWRRTRAGSSIRQFHRICWATALTGQRSQPSVRPSRSENSISMCVFFPSPATPSSRTSPSSMRCTMGSTAAQMHAGKTAWGGCSMWWVGVCSVVFSSSDNKKEQMSSGSDVPSFTS